MKVIASRQIPIVNTHQVVWQPVTDNGDRSMRLAPIDWQPSGAHACIQMLADDLRDVQDKLTECEARLSKAVEALRFYAPTKRHLTERWFIQNFGGHDDGELAAATLAELEGKK